MTKAVGRLLTIGALLGMTATALAARPEDLQTVAHVQQRLAEYTGLKSERILVQVDNGRVALIGTVETAQMKEAATSAALSVTGVTMIDNNLSVAGEIPSDVQLETAVAEALKKSALTANSIIVAHASKGEITLEGAVPSDLAWREATRLTQTVIGVRGIRNHLTVTNAQTAVLPAGE